MPCARASTCRACRSGSICARATILTLEARRDERRGRRRKSISIIWSGARSIRRCRRCCNGRSSAAGAPWSRRRARSESKRWTRCCGPMTRKASCRMAARATGTRPRSPSISPRVTTIPMRRRCASWSTARRSPTPRLMPASPMCSTAAMRKRLPARVGVAGGEGARRCGQLLAAGCRRALAAKGVSEPLIHGRTVMPRGAFGIASP